MSHSICAVDNTDCLQWHQISCSNHGEAGALSSPGYILQLDEKYVVHEVFGFMWKTVSDTENYVKTFPAWKWNEGFFSVRFTCEKQPTQAGFWNYCKLCVFFFFICGGFWYILHIILRKLSALRWSFFIYTLALFCGHFGSLKLNEI